MFSPLNSCATACWRSIHVFIGACVPAVAAMLRKQGREAAIWRLVMAQQDGDSDAEFAALCAVGVDGSLDDLACGIAALMLQMIALKTINVLVADHWRGMDFKMADKTRNE